MSIEQLEIRSQKSTKNSREGGLAAALFQWMNNLLFNNTGQLRSGWRAAIFLTTFVLSSAAFIFAALTAFSILPAEPNSNSYLLLIIPFTLSAAIAIILGWAYGKLFEGLPFSALGISFRGKWLSNFVTGCIVGALALTTAVIIAVITGGMSLALNRESAASAILTTLLTALAIFAVAALSEEALFRGYLLQTFTRAKLIPVGVGVTSVLFAFAHNQNPDVNSFALLNTFLAGIWFAAAYLKTRDLWFPFGIHLMWNWLQGPVFGISVSGISDLNRDPILRASDIGPAWLTGGSYGIEGGVACTLAIAISIAGIFFFNAKSQSRKDAKGEH